MQASRDQEIPKAGVKMSPAVVTNNWRQLSKAARQEHDPKKFVYLLKRLYDLVNEGRTVDRNMAKAA